LLIFPLILSVHFGLVFLSPPSDGPILVSARRGANAALHAWNPASLLHCENCRIPAGQAIPSTWKSVPPADTPQANPEAEGSGPRLRQHLFFVQRAYPRHSLPPGALLRAWTQARRLEVRSRINAVSTWQNIGPAPMRHSQIGSQKVNVSGRVTALAIDPRHSNVVYLGTAMGGLWKTTNGGASWLPLTDGQPSLAIGALALAPSNPNIIYAGTGEPSPGLDNYYGMGLLKSTDGGHSWQLLGQDIFSGVAISAIAVHPTNPNLLYVATARTGVTGSNLPVRGIFRSQDGGKTWKGLLGCRDCWGASDLLLDPTDPNVLYAAFWAIGILKTTDGGHTWSRLTQGLPDKNFDRIELALAPAQTNVLYAGYEYRIPGRFRGGIVFKSDDGGKSWTWLDKTPNYCTSQCWYDNVIAVDPKNADVVYIGGSANYIWQPVTHVKGVVIRSTNGGASWEDLTPNDTPNHTLHPDVHAIAIDPQNPNIIWVGNDGGVWRSNDGGKTWQDRNTNLATLQFTGVGVHPTNANVLFGGMQDNNKARTTGNRAWEALDVGDGGYAAIDPFNPNFYYGSRFGISFQRNEKGGSAAVADWPIKIQGIDKHDRTLFYAPFALDPSTPGVLYFGTHRLYRSTNRGDSWTPISGDLTKGQKTNGRISTIAVAPSDPKTIYVGTSDGNVQVTVNGGSSWHNVTHPPLPNRWVSHIGVDPKNPKAAYVVFNGFNTHTPNTPGHVFETSDGGTTWQDISGNLPDVPALSIALDPHQRGVLYLGTDVGVFRTLDGGAHWTLFGRGLPAVPVVDLHITGKGTALIAATHGRSVYRIALASAGATPTATPASPTPLPGATPTRPAFTPHAVLHLPAMLKTTRSHLPTPSPTPAGTLLPTATPTPTPPPSPTATATAPGPSPTPTPPPSPRVYYDDFSNPSSGWAAQNLGRCEMGYVNGSYAIALYQMNQVCYSLAPTTPRADGVFEALMAKSNVNDGSVYGLIFGGNSADHLTQFYVFWVDPADQTYLLQRYEAGTWTNVTQVGTSAAIATGNQVNVLKVRRQGSQITLYVNGLDLVTLQDDRFPGNGYVGLAAWQVYNTSSAVAYFDDFKVTEPTTVLADDFSNPGSGWPVGKSNVCQAAYRGGQYATVTQPDWACVYRAPAGPYPNGSFQVTASRRSNEAYPTAYGVAFAEDGTFTSLYAFLIIPDTQEYALALYNGGWFGLTQDPSDGDVWVSSSAIHTGGEPNTLKVVRDASKIHLLVNGHYLETVQNITLLGQGFFGVISWPSTYAPGTVYFDNFRAVAWDEPFSSSVPRRPASTAGLSAPPGFAVPRDVPWTPGRSDRGPRLWPVPGNIQGR